jgi:hypothetical protein
MHHPTLHGIDTSSASPCPSYMSTSATRLHGCTGKLCVMIYTRQVCTRPPPCVAHASHSQYTIAIVHTPTCIYDHRSGPVPTSHPNHPTTMLLSLTVLTDAPPHHTAMCPPTPDAGPLMNRHMLCRHACAAMNRAGLLPNATSHVSSPLSGILGR